MKANRPKNGPPQPIWQPYEDIRCKIVESWNNELCKEQIEVKGRKENLVFFLGKKKTEMKHDVCSKIEESKTLVK